MEWVLASLLVGHFAGDFALQPRSLVARKYANSALFEHGALLYTAHLVAFYPFLSARGALVLMAIVGMHLAIDWTKLFLKSRMNAPKRLFVADQALHVLTCVAAWLALGEIEGPGWGPGYVGLLGLATVVAGIMVWWPDPTANGRQG